MLKLIDNIMRFVFELFLVQHTTLDLVSLSHSNQLNDFSRFENLRNIPVGTNLIIRPINDDNTVSEKEMKNLQIVIRSRIACGSFGQVYVCDTNISNVPLAIKFELLNSDFKFLDIENEVYKSIGNTKTPKLYIYGTTDYNCQVYNVLVLDLLGENLETLFKLCGYKFSYQTVFRFGLEAISSLEVLHNLGWIHRDIKPENFVVDSEKKESIYLIDYGLSKRYIDSVTKKHTEHEYANKVYGTLKYSSINALKQMEQGRRDDLVSLGYVLIDLLNGCLPWEVTGTTNFFDAVNIIRSKKESTSLINLCKDLPIQILKYMEIVTRLEHDENPNYELLKSILEEGFRIYKSKKIQFDWNRGNVFN